MNSSTTLNLVLRCTEPDKARRKSNLAKLVQRARKHHEEAQSARLIMEGRADLDSMGLRADLLAIEAGWCDLTGWAERNAK